eukprot:2727941-Prymnesium_polylepis.1
MGPPRDQRRIRLERSNHEAAAGPTPYPLAAAVGIPYPPPPCRGCIGGTQCHRCVAALVCGGTGGATVFPVTMLPSGNRPSSRVDCSP